MSKHIIISRKFAEKLSALSRQIQKGVNGIYNKLAKNAEGTGLNLEPIQGAASPSMKSVRVNDNYRIVLHQDSKGTFTFLHIDTHDAAYAWARRNKFEVNPYTGEVQLYVVDIPEVRVDGGTTVTQGEQESATTAAASGPFANTPSDEDLKRLGVPESQIPLVRSLKDDEDILAHEEDFSQGVFDALLLAFDGKNADEIIKELGIASKGANIDDVAKAVAEALGLKNVEVVNARAESLNRRFGFVVSRAVASLTDFYPWVKGKFTEGILYLKGGDVVEEIAEVMARHRLPRGSVHTWPVNAWLHDPYYDGKLVIFIEK